MNPYLLPVCHSSLNQHMSARCSDQLSIRRYMSATETLSSQPPDFITIHDVCRCAIEVEFRRSLPVYGMSLRSLGVELHCRCIQTESKPIGRHIEKVELIPANSHCQATEIIATLKKTRQEVCLDPNAPWVKKVIQKIMSSGRR
ncbi:interleukin-8-like isoform X1 [Embiotoca jacksoni]|uniref:interleukin-8-like isoform X1 n=1 Tax=Embiotoca jacksoni TaxID=100190 RepID=UPI003704191E